MEYVNLVGSLAVLQFFFFGFMTGAARRKSGLKAPAVTGHPYFERMYRVQTNTLETIVAFLPTLFIAAQYWSPIVISIVGIVYIVGRFIYWRAYVASPEKRGLGFMLSMLPTLVLIVLSIVGALIQIANT
jgi:uncharacterized MAPEG superfamily protein